MSKVLVDTNVLVYAIDADSKYYEKSRSLLFDPTKEVFTTSKNIAEFLSVLTRAKKSISIEDAVKTADDFSHFISVIYPDARSFSLFKRLLLRHKPSGLTVHDMEIASIALSNYISCIATFNTKDFAAIDGIQLYDF